MKVPPRRGKYGGFGVGVGAGAGAGMVGFVLSRMILYRSVLVLVRCGVYYFRTVGGD